MKRCSILSQTLLAFFLSLIAVPAFSQSTLTKISNFGTNPGNLEMYLYKPSNMPTNAPLVIAMHGCTQSAQSYADECGWSTLAERYKFYVIYPQQNSGNNSSKCFNWFESGDINRGQGEARSIKSMTDYMLTNFSINTNRIHVTGFSAGGAMTTVMLATYPDVFSAGAVMSGLPYKAATSLTGAFSAMSPGVDKSPSQWGSLVKNAYSSYTGPYPRISIFHGTSDYTIKNMNLTEIAEQWTNLHATDQVPDITYNSFENNNRITQKIYKTNSGQAVVVTYDIANMGHSVAINPGSGEKQGGTVGGYATDVDFFSSYYAANFFGITEPTDPNPPTSISAPTNLIATALSASSVNIKWTDNSNNEENFKIERSSSSTSGFTKIASLPANSTQYSDGNLTASTTYYYRVRAADNTSFSTYSNVAKISTPSSGGGNQTDFIIEQPVSQGYLALINTYHSAQSFTLSQSAILKKVEVGLRNAVSNSTLKIFAGNTVTGTPLYTQSNISLSSGWQSMLLTTPLSLSAGQYTFQLTNSVFGYSFTNTYNEGNIWLGSISYAYYDAAFKLTFSISSVNTSAFLGPKEGNFAPISRNKFSLYPNPTKGIFTIKNPYHSNINQITIINITGKAVLHKTVTNPDHLVINLQNYPAGVYFVRIETLNFTDVQQVVME